MIPLRISFHGALCISGDARRADLLLQKHTGTNGQVLSVGRDHQMSVNGVFHFLKRTEHAYSDEMFAAHGWERRLQIYRNTSISSPRFTFNRGTIDESYHSVWNCYWPNETEHEADTRTGNSTTKSI
jgi:hypothetical protein